MDLETLRKKEGISKMEAAAKAKVSLPTWEKYETGRATPSPSLLDIIGAFGLTAKIDPSGIIDFAKIRNS